MKQKIISGVVVDQDNALTMAELAQACSVQRDFIRQLVDEGILQPTEVNAEQWSFSNSSLRRVNISLRLQRDLQVNLPGIAVILDLLEEQ